MDEPALYAAAFPVWLCPTGCLLCHVWRRCDELASPWYSDYLKRLVIDPSYLLVLQALPNTIAIHSPGTTPRHPILKRDKIIDSFIMHIYCVLDIWFDICKLQS